MGLEVPQRRVVAHTPARGRWPAVVSASALAVGLWLARAAYVGVDHLWLGWNLFLAWIPWVLSTWILRADCSRPALVAGGAAWLLFLPNAPYLVTDFVHFRPAWPVPPWFDVMLFATFSLAGCALGWTSLETMHALLARRLGARRSLPLMAALVLATGFGVYLGRFLRLNSWDVLTRPHEVVVTAVASLADPRAAVFSLIFAAFVGVGYLLLSPRVDGAPEG